MNYIFSNSEWEKKLLDRFVKYVKIWSESCGEEADKGTFPSTSRQWDFAKTLADEMQAIGMQNVQVTDKCYVYGCLEATKGCENVEPILLLSHMDTVDEVSGKNVNPVITKNQDDTIISSDKTTLLGADDKAGITAIMTSIEFLLQNNGKPEFSHGLIEVIFSPDEETGHGMDFVPINLIKSKKAYTVDGGEEGEMETECFNAWSGSVEFTGKACHTGDAKKNHMVNANLMAANFICRLPKNMRPETTENHQGFIAVMETSSSIEKSAIQLLLRAFNLKEIENQKKIIEKAAKKASQKFCGKADIKFRQQYLNMKEKISKFPEVVANLEKAYELSGVKIIKKPIRGGTDGSRLTEMGIPCPNIFTGGHEFHSRNEWCSLNQMSKSADVLINLEILKNV